MRISHCQIFSFTSPLTRPLTVGKETLEKRTGLIVRLGNEEGLFALGEVSPLPGLSLENMRQAGQQLTQLGKWILKRDVPDGLESFSGGFDRWLGSSNLVPSVRFGFEAAVLGLSAASQGVRLPELLCDRPSDVVMVNGLLSGARLAVMEKAERLLAEGYKAFKLKVGRLALEEDISVVRELQGLIGEHVLLRLDANRAWGIDQTLAFASGLSDATIDYLEEPVGSFALLSQLLKEPAMTLPLAIDESLLEMDPGNLLSCSGVKAVVLKPTLLGIEKTMQFAREALRVGMTPVISSAFESSVGITVLAQIASSLNQGDVPAGLDTLDWLAQDLLESPLPIEHGALAVPALPNVVEALNGHLLQVVDDV